MKLVIAGALYFDGEMLLVPHYTGEFVVVDCDRYMSLEDLKDIYNELFIEEAMESPVSYNNKKYYPAEYGPFNVKDWELLSDLSDLNHLEENYDF